MNTLEHSNQSSINFSSNKLSCNNNTSSYSQLSPIQQNRPSSKLTSINWSEIYTSTPSAIAPHYAELNRASSVTLSNASMTTNEMMPNFVSLDSSTKEHNELLKRFDLRNEPEKTQTHTNANFHQKRAFEPANASDDSSQKNSHQPPQKRQAVEKSNSYTSIPDSAFDISSYSDSSSDTSFDLELNNLSSSLDLTVSRENYAALGKCIAQVALQYFTNPEGTFHYITENGYDMVNETYWSLNSDIPPQWRLQVDATPADAVEDIFIVENRDRYSMECATARTFIKLAGLLEYCKQQHPNQPALGKATFNQLFKVDGAYQLAICHHKIFSDEGERIQPFAQVVLGSGLSSDWQRIEEGMSIGRPGFFRNINASIEGWETGHIGENVIQVGNDRFVGHPYGLHPSEEWETMLGEYAIHSLYQFLEYFDGQTLPEYRQASFKPLLDEKRALQERIQQVKPASRRLAAFFRQKADNSKCLVTMRWINKHFADLSLIYDRNGELKKPRFITRDLINMINNSSESKSKLIQFIHGSNVDASEAEQFDKEHLIHQSTKKLSALLPNLLNSLIIRQEELSCLHKIAEWCDEDVLQYEWYQEHGTLLESSSKEALSEWISTKLPRLAQVETIWSDTHVLDKSQKITLADQMAELILHNAKHEHQSALFGRSGVKYIPGTLIAPPSSPNSFHINRCNQTHFVLDFQ